MILLEDLKPNALVKGLLDQEAVRIVSAEMMGDAACLVVFRREDGGVGETIVFRSSEVGLELLPAKSERRSSRVYRQVLLMVSELHLRGYQRLRIAPGMSPSGMCWRCSVTPVSNILQSHGARMADWNQLAAHYTSGHEDRYFGWKGVGRLTASRLAVRFIKEFPHIVEAGRGRDWLYVDWYQEMLGLTYPDFFPGSELVRRGRENCLETIRHEPHGAELERLLPAPPPGEASGEGTCP